MKCREVWNRRDEHFTLTEDEERYLRALERLSKMNPGRICLMANGRVRRHSDKCRRNCFSPGDQP